MTSIYLVRHGWTAWHTEGRIAGWLDAPLDERGRAEASAAAYWLVGHCQTRSPLLISSPVLRAHQTAQVIAEAFDPSLALRVDPAIGETRVTNWEGMLADDVVRTEPSWQEFHKGPADFRFPGGETGREVQARAVALVESLHSGSGQDEIILVSHAEPIRGILAHYLGMNANLYYRLRVDCGSVSRISLPGRADPDRPSPKARVDFLNRTQAWG